MGSISITCPTTGETVSTGMTMERESFYRSVLTGNSVKCPHCSATLSRPEADANFDCVEAPGLRPTRTIPGHTTFHRRPKVPLHSHDIEPELFDRGQQ